MFTSHLALGEVLAGGSSGQPGEQIVRETLGELGFKYLPSMRRSGDVRISPVKLEAQNS